MARVFRKEDFLSAPTPATPTVPTVIQLPQTKIPPQEALTVRNLTVTGTLTLDRPEQLYPPNPHIFKSPSIVFAPDQPPIVSLVHGDTSFLTYHKDTHVVEVSTAHIPTLLTHTLETDTITTSKITVPGIDVSFVRTDRLETQATEIGKVLLKDSSVYATGNVHVGKEVIANEGSIGGVRFHNTDVNAGRLSASTLTCTYANTRTLDTAEIRCEAECVTFAGVELIKGHVYASTVTAQDAIHARALHGDSVTAETVYTDTLGCVSGSSLFVTGGLVTQRDSDNAVGCLFVSASRAVVEGSMSCTLSMSAPSLVASNVSADTLTASNVCAQTLSCESLVGTSLSCESVHTKTLTVDEDMVLPNCTIGGVTIRDDVLAAGEYRLSDGTSLLAALFPRGLIALYQGKHPPRGWMKSSLPPPSEDVIYIVRS